MRIYSGTRFASGAVVTVECNGNFAPLPRRLDLSNHKPSGFEWGYGGSGPAQLALAILADCLCDDTVALALHQDFKWAFIAGIKTPEWRLTSGDVLDWVARQRRLRRREPSLS
jgi:hypothetical protein